MKGILKIYHPEETLKYHIQKTYCKVVYAGKENLLEVEIATDDSLDHVEDDSLQYNFPQIALKISDFPVKTKNPAEEHFKIPDEEAYEYIGVDLFDDETADVYENELIFSENENGDLQLVWSGKIDDFYTGADKQIPFKLKCKFTEEEDVAEEENAEK